jgi:DNA-binding response OmpR family regulator
MVTEVLVIDDDHSLLRMVTVALQDSGLRVVTATNGIDGLQALSNARPGVVVLDLEMPVMDGRAFYREMRSRGYSTPVLILSAYDARQANRELNASGYIDKPFDPDELVDRLRDLIAAAGSTL